MFKKYKILMSPEKCTYYSGIFSEKSYLQSKKSCEFNLNGLRKNSKIHIVVEGKEVFIEQIIFRRAKKSQIIKLVECALIERFHSLNEIAFDFKIMKRDKFETMVIIFCLNIGNLPLSNEKIFKGIKIKSVEIIQQLYVKKLRRLIKCKSFEGLIISQDFLYYLKVYKGIIVSNKVVVLDLLYEDEELINLCKEANDEGRIIYTYCEGNEEVLNSYLSPYEKIEIYRIKRKKERKYSNIVGELMNGKYLPQWYFNNQFEEYKKYTKNIVILFILFSLVIVINIYGDFKELVIYNNKIDAFMLFKDNDKVKDFHIYHSFNYMYDVLSSNKMNVRKLNIDYDDIYIEIYAQDIKEYKEKLEALEEKFSISEISPLNSEDDKKYFGVRMKIYEN